MRTQCTRQAGFHEKENRLATHRYRLSRPAFVDGSTELHSLLEQLHIHIILRIEIYRVSKTFCQLQAHKKEKDIRNTLHYW